MEIPDLSVRDDCAAAASDPYVRHLRALQAEAGGDGLDEGDAARLRLLRLVNTASNMVKEAVFGRVLRHLRDHGIEDVAPLKGMYLLQTLYQDCSGIRPMADVDLLVRRSDFPKAKAAMAGMGRVGSTYSLRPLYSALHHEFPCIVDRTLVEVHRGQTTLDVFGMDYGAILDEAERVETANGVRLLRMPLEHATAIQVFHDLSDGLASAMPLTWLKIAQVHVLIHNAGAGRVREACERFGIGHFLDLYLHILARVFVSVPPPVEDVAWHAGVRRGRQTPFEYGPGELLFRARLFRGALLRKAAPNLVTKPVDFALRLLGVSRLGVRRRVRDVRRPALESAEHHS